MTFRPATPETHHRETVTLPIDPVKANQAMEESLIPEEREVKLLALCLHNEAELEAVLQGASPQMRAGMLDLIGPYLTFRTELVVTPDCPVCGLKRGSVISHECLASN